MQSLTIASCAKNAISNPYLDEITGIGRQRKTGLASPHMVIGKVAQRFSCGHLSFNPHSFKTAQTLVEKLQTESSKMMKVGNRIDRVLLLSCARPCSLPIHNGNTQPKKRWRWHKATRTIRIFWTIFGSNCTHKTGQLCPRGPDS